MKENFRGINFADLCSWFGVSRQAYYQAKRRVIRQAIEEELLIAQITPIRKAHKKMGARKLLLSLEPFMSEHNIKMGRDAFFDFLRDHGLLIRKRKRYHVTTNSRHWLRKYPNLIKETVPIGPNHIWVSDITYWKTIRGHYYISFVTDAFSRKILGYNVASDLSAMESVKALKMALKSLPKGASGLIHHSDRGTQYCSAEYVQELNARQIGISMTENGDPLENPIAERINGIIKGEYLFDYEIKSLKQARNILEAVVALYNDERPHSSIGYATPSRAYNHPLSPEIKRLWKNYYRKQPQYVI